MLRKGLNSLIFYLPINHCSAVFAEIEVALDFFLIFNVDFVVAACSWTLHFFFTFQS